uniref:Transmembrane protein n=1 Tax=Parascaris equorum TaxID=6256 RepID=A0A914RZ92_PAREQ
MYAIGMSHSLQYSILFSVIKRAINQETVRRCQGLQVALAVTTLSYSMNNIGHSTTRLRTKQPVYTSDKRAKFTQRENKKWIRFGTVVGYIFFVSLPAVALSIYYIYIWDPGYVTKVFQLFLTHRSVAVKSGLEFNGSNIHSYQKILKEDM